MGLRRVAVTPGHGLGSEVDIPGEHRGDAGNLLPLVHHVVARGVRLKVQRDPPRHSRENREEVPGGGRLRVELLAQRLDEPRSVGGVAPRVEPGNGAVCDEKVRVAGYLVGVRVRVRLGLRYGMKADATVELNPRTNFASHSFLEQQLCRVLLPFKLAN